MKDIIQHKGTLDGTMVAGGGVYVFLSESLPIIIGILTAILFVIRIAVAIQEWRINRKEIKKSR